MNCNPFPLIHFGTALFHSMLIYPFVSASTISPEILNAFFSALHFILDFTALSPVATFPPHNDSSIQSATFPYKSLPPIWTKFSFSCNHILFWSYILVLSTHYFFLFNGNCILFSYTKIYQELNSSLNLADCTAVILPQKLPGLPHWTQIAWMRFMDHWTKRQWIG